MEFSVLMSVYYKENPEYIKLSLDSVIKQTVPAAEIVLIKDGPLTKELDDIINQYGDKYAGLFRVFSLEENVGLGKALNYGVQCCKYDLIARMDTDDIAVPNRFELQIKEFIKDNELVLCGAQIAEFEDNPQVINGYRKVPLTQKEILKFSKKRNPFNHMTVMFRKQAILDAGKYQEMPYFEDYWLWIRILQKRYVVKNIDKILVNVRAGAEMLDRRGGLSYARASYIFLKATYDSGLICYSEYLVGLVIRISFVMMPTCIRKFLYNKILRKSGDNNYDT